MLDGLSVEAASLKLGTFRVLRYWESIFALDLSWLEHLPQRVIGPDPRWILLTFLPILISQAWMRTGR